MMDGLRRYTRQRRGQTLYNFLKTFPRPLKIIDLGGTVRFWETLGVTDADGLTITLVNNHEMDKTSVGQINRFGFVHEWVADALTISEDDLGRFGLIFSNSFIEHLSCREQQAFIASRIMRSERPYFIQTPNKRSPIDPHFPHACVPFFALYPKRVQARLLTLGELGGGWKAPSIEAALDALKFYNPLCLQDLRVLFPGAELHVERPFGVPMSILAIHRGSPAKAALPPAFSE